MFLPPASAAASPRARNAAAMASSCFALRLLSGWNVCVSGMSDAMGTPLRAQYLRSVVASWSLLSSSSKARK